MGACVAFEDWELEALERTFAAGTWVDLRDRSLLTHGCSWPARVSEMLVLTEAVVTDEKGRVAGMWHCTAAHNKTGTPTDYEITPAAREALEAWLPVRRRAGYRRNDPLFPAVGRAGAMTRQAAWKMVKRRCAAAGLELRGKGTHSMKCTSISNVHESFTERAARGEKGVDPLRDTQAYSGHKSINSLLHYLRPRRKEARAEGFTAADKRAAALMGKGKAKRAGEE
jgi:integrase